MRKIASVLLIIIIILTFACSNKTMSSNNITNESNNQKGANNGNLVIKTGYSYSSQWGYTIANVIFENGLVPLFFSSNPKSML